MAKRPTVPLRRESIEPEACTLHMRRQILKALPFFRALGEQDIARIDGSFRDQGFQPQEMRSEIRRLRCQSLRKQQRLDERISVEIEGKFGVIKRKYSLGRVMAKLARTSETAIGIVFLVIFSRLLEYSIRFAREPIYMKFAAARNFGCCSLQD